MSLVLRILKKCCVLVQVTVENTRGPVNIECRSGKSNVRCMTDVMFSTGNKLFLISTTCKAKLELTHLYYIAANMEFDGKRFRDRGAVCNSVFVHIVSCLLTMGGGNRFRDLK